MRFHVESWAPEYGTPAESQLAESAAEVDLGKEVPADRWAPITPDRTTAAPQCIVFVDGVRRIDARLWVDTTTDGLRQGVAASYAAGAVRCERSEPGGASASEPAGDGVRGRSPRGRGGGRAKLVDARVERGVFCTGEGVHAITTRHATWCPFPAAGEAPEQLWLAVQNRMADLEAKAAIAAGAGADAALVVVDGPLRDRRHVPGVVGYVKTHHVRYLGPGHEETIAALRAGQRTPLFHIGGGFARWSWYLRLPHGVGHPWAGIVRGEAPPGLEVADVVALADQLTAALPRFASEPHKDPRAPQNLHPIAGLERELRRRLGDARLLERALRVAAA
jgi:hypothetical protein